MFEVDILSGAREVRARLTIKDRFVMYIGNELNSTRASIARYLWLLEDRRINDVTVNFYFFYGMKFHVAACLFNDRSQKTSKCWKEHQRHTRLTARVPLFRFLPNLDVICDVLQNKRTATWNLFANLIKTNDQNRAFPLLWKISVFTHN